MDKQGDIITRGMGGEDADYSFKSMIKNYVRIATLNARSILKVANPQHQKSYTKYLRSKHLDLDIICLQEVTPHQPTTETSCQLTSKQSKRLEMSYNNKDMIYTKHCAVICLNQKYHLTSSGITKDGRCIFSTLIDTQNNNICNLITWYAPADYKERKILYDQILQLPIMYSPPTDLIILGDFNLHIGTKIRTIIPISLHGSTATLRTFSRETPVKNFFIHSIGILKPRGLTIYSVVTTYGQNYSTLKIMLYRRIGRTTLYYPRIFMSTATNSDLEHGASIQLC